ncbi:hypothetical protein F503_02803 [Ophiostoma piceae UAMH 11346]|uniref:Duf431 domain-containing protein n=1 Tax=Ophiostoma piceae (strain UAMH 11346) TaxID=1262450 RepID=S3BXI7_OPHP1|nr:hypothetical protein F503_02803 [Ophiostoma piceae UAMH 11346]
MTAKRYIVEHLDEELGAWSQLEYIKIARETGNFCLSSIPDSLKQNLPETLTSTPGFVAETRGVEDVYGQDPALKARVCLLDPAAAQELSPEDGELFDVFLFGGILGDDPPRDRTSELRKKGFTGRRLGPKQMTTDTAVRVTRIVAEKKIPLEKIEYLDFPSLQFNEHESTEMPFRYVKGEDGKPIMPDGMVELIKKDADKAIDDLF